MDSEESDDARAIELSSLSAIYPEIQTEPSVPHSFSLELPVNPAKAIQVFFPAPATAQAAVPVPGPAPPSTGPSGCLSQPRAGPDHNGCNGAPLEESHELAYLPSVRLQISLPEGYPLERPPTVSLSTTPSWIPQHRIKQLEAECERLWEDLGRDSVVFSYIDYVQQSADSAFGVVDGQGALKVDLQHKIAILDYDISAKRAAFEKETFDCGVCLDPKKGSACHRMLDCGHVFCVKCLQDFYNNAIKEGDLSSVRCLAPNCARERELAAAGAGPATIPAGQLTPGGGKKKRKPKLITPSELLQIPLEHDVVKRYVALRYKMELESDKNTIYCPRLWCHGAARSEKHKKPMGFELVEGEDGSDEDEEGGGGGGAAGDANHAQQANRYKPTTELLSICEDCNFAFCSRCLQSWHGAFMICFPPRDDKELTAEEKASLEYLDLHTTPCPTCAAPAQKTHGCNHMICGRQGCGTHFCYLCSAWLDPSNPYSHYNHQPGQRITGCFGRLWELEEGDGAEVGLQFAGGEQRRPERVRDQPLPPRRAMPIPAAAPPPAVLVPEIEEPEDADDPREGPHRAGAAAEDGLGRGGQNNDDNRRVQERVALEAPLVLRIAAEPPAARGPPPPPAVPAPPLAPGPGARQPRNRNQNQNQNQNQRGQPGHDGGGGGGARGGGRNAAGRGRGGRARGRANPAARVEAAGAAPPIAEPRQMPEAQLDGDLNDAQRAWVQQFVQLALNDEEDLLDSDGEDDDEEMVFWIR